MNFYNFKLMDVLEFISLDRKNSYSAIERKFIILTIKKYPKLPTIWRWFGLPDQELVRVGSSDDFDAWVYIDDDSSIISENKIDCLYLEYSKNKKERENKEKILSALTEHVMEK